MLSELGAISSEPNRLVRLFLSPEHRRAADLIANWMRDAGMAVAELGRQHGFSPASFYAWRAKYGGMEAEDSRRLKELESENNRLKRLLADAHLDIEALKIGFGVKR